MILDLSSKRSPFFFAAFLEFEVLYYVKIQIAFSGRNSRKIVTTILLRIHSVIVFIGNDWITKIFVCSSAELKTWVKTYVFAL